MADPRLSPKFDGIDPVYATFKIDNSTIVYDQTKAGGSAGAGLAVNLSASSTIQLVSDAAFVMGKLIRTQVDNIASVQVGGVVLLGGGNGASLTAGNSIVGALQVSSAKGYIRNTANATLAEVAVANGRIYDAADATNVVVYLT